MRRTQGLSVNSVLFLAFLVGLYGCSGGDPNKGIDIQPTVKVTGKVLVDGQPSVMPVRVKAYLADHTSEKDLGAAGATDADGVFELSTYKQNDGIPPGEYKLTFLAFKPNLMSGGGGRMDELGGQYSDRHSSQFTVTVADSEEVQDLGVFELKKAANPTLVPDDRN